MYRRCPSAYSVSKAKLLLPLPDTPVRQIRRFFGNVRVTSARLCSRAPAIVISPGSAAVVISSRPKPADRSSVDGCRPYSLSSKMDCVLISVRSAGNAWNTCTWNSASRAS